MLNFEEELKNFKPSLEIGELEEALYQEDISDLTDILKEVVEESKS
jgi:hypothetical protein